VVEHLMRGDGAGELRVIINPLGISSATPYPEAKIEPSAKLGEVGAGAGDVPPISG
jgi:hypothetical protein